MTDKPCSGKLTASAIARLQQEIAKHSSMAIAFSGGTDSTLLARIAGEVLKENLLLVHVRSSLIKPSETDFCTSWAQHAGINFIAIDFSPFECEHLSSNHPLRCYYCKRLIIEAIRETASARNITTIADGANCDDLDDYRPGLKASDELGVIHPFIAAGFNKNMIRRLSRKYTLPNWNTPASACLASRVAYHTRITPEILGMVALAEDFLLSLGFDGCRVRYVEQRAEIEVDPSYFRHIMSFRKEITDKLKQLGFIAVLLNLEGYRQGAMNRTLTEK